METQTRAHIPRKESCTGVRQPMRETAITSVPRSPRIPKRSPEVPRCPQRSPDVPRGPQEVPKRRRAGQRAHP
eukprot:6982042-Heterocapsa_arctica.AAC.1